MKTRKRVDEVIHGAHDEAFRDIDCLECANCCKTTGPLLTRTDIARISRKQKMTETQFVERYLRLDEDGDHVFRSMPCPFLLDDNRCGVYEYRPKACREFPHTDQAGQVDIFHLTRKNARVCPAVSQIIQLVMEQER